MAWTSGQKLFISHFNSRKTMWLDHMRPYAILLLPVPSRLKYERKILCIYLQAPVVFLDYIIKLVKIHRGRCRIKKISFVKVYLHGNALMVPGTIQGWFNFTYLDKTSLCGDHMWRITCHLTCLVNQAYFDRINIWNFRIVILKHIWIIKWAVKWVRNP